MDIELSANPTDPEQPQSSASSAPDVKSNLAPEPTQGATSAHNSIQTNSDMGNRRKRFRLDSIEGYGSEEERHDTEVLFGTPGREYINPDIAKQSENCFDCFLTVRPFNSTENLTTVSILKLSKELKQINVKPINVINVGKQLTIQVSHYKETINLLKCTSLCGIPVIVEPHSKLNTSKGVIKCPHLKDCTVEEIVEEIPNVIDAHRMTIKKDNKILNTNTWVLTFNTPKCPNMIETCSWVKNVQVTPYIPKPMRCYKCQRIGHTQKRCKGTPRCRRCGEAPHGTCEKDPFCPNCKEAGHTGTSNECPILIKTKQILKHQAENGGTFAQAKEALFPKNTPYSNTIKGKPQQKQNLQNIITNPNVFQFGKKTKVQSPNNQTSIKNPNNFQQSKATSTKEEPWRQGKLPNPYETIKLQNKFELLAQINNDQQTTFQTNTTSSTTETLPQTNLATSTTV